jgi:hypothetical protein
MMVARHDLTLALLFLFYLNKIVFPQLVLIMDAAMSVFVHLPALSLVYAINAKGQS